MNVTLKKIFVLICVVLLFVSVTIPVFASDDNNPYEFTMKAFGTNNYYGHRYRQTNLRTNKWKVNMFYNAEGINCKTIYWLARYSDKNGGSDEYTVKSFTGNHYYYAYPCVNQRYVCLGCRNNNNTKQTYTVSGFWDEETK